MTVVVADTGIYVSALVFGGVPQTALIQILDPPFSVAVSEEIKAELTETLTRKFGWPDVRVTEACRHLWTHALWCEPVTVQASRDPDDDHPRLRARRICQGDRDRRQGPSVAASVPKYRHRDTGGISGAGMGGS